MNILLIYAVISLGFGVKGHVECENGSNSRVLSKTECKVLSYATSPLWPLVVVNKVKETINKPDKIEQQGMRK